MIRILFLSDTHLGFDYPFRPRIQRRRRGNDFFANLDQALKPAMTGQVDCVIHGGDLLYRSKVPARLVTLAAAPLKAVADSGTPVYLVPGNHERSVIPHFERMQHPRIFVFDRPRTFYLKVGGMRLALAGFPFYRGPIRQAFNDLLAATNWHRHDADASVLCIHQSVDGARVGPKNYTFRNKPDVIDTAALPAGLVGVLAGHIHRHQVIQKDLGGRRLNCPVFFPGSIERTSFAEKDEDKGYLTLTVDEVSATKGRLKSWQFHQLPARPMIRMDLHLHNKHADEVTDRLRDLIRGLPADAVVRLRLYGRPGKSVFERIKAASLRELAPASMNIDAVLMASGRYRRRKSRQGEIKNTRTPEYRRPSWQKPLFQDPPKRKTEP